MNATVLICTYNSARNLPRTLDHLRQQKLSTPVDWEVIVVDYVGSTDGTADVVRALWKGSRVPLRLFRESRKGKTPALHTGFRHALGEAVCIVDDDNWLDEGFIETAVRTIENHSDVGVVGGYGQAVCEVLPPKWFEDVKEMYAVGHQAKESGYVHGCLSFWGAGSVIRNSAWRRLESQGFSPVLNPCRSDGITFDKSFTGGEDPELCYAIQLLGYRLWYEPSLKYWHHIPAARLTIDYVLSTARGVNMASPILKLYQARLQATSPYLRLRSRVLSIWWLHFFASVVMFCCNEVRQLPDKESLVRKRRRECYLGQIRGLCHWKRQFRTIVTSIERLDRGSES